MTDDGQLLRQYVRLGSQAAFSQLVTRHLNFVYSVCLREVGDAVLAEDVTLVVFLILAKKAPALRVEPSLSGWLFQTARFAAKNARRREANRKMSEKNASEQMPPAEQDENALWDQIEPHLNDALASLGTQDRTAVLLRFADGLSFPELSAVLGTSEDAARMRLNRAVERLRKFFAKEGITTLSGVVLIGLLADRTVQAAPATCTVAIAKIAEGVTTGGVTNSVSAQVHSQLQGVLKAMVISKLKFAATLGVGIVLAGSLPFVTRAQNPTSASAPRTPAITAVPTPTAASGPPLPESAGNATLASLNKLRLSRPFTLKYSAVTKDVSTPEMWANSKKWAYLSYKSDIQSGISEADAADNLRSTIERQCKHQPEYHFDVTISSDGDKLFYQKTETDNQQTIIYNGEKTYSYEAATHRMDINSGLMLNMLYYPIPGVSLPHLSLLHPSAASGKSKGLLVKGDVLQIDAFCQGGQYLPGEITLADQDNSKKISTMSLLYRGFPSEKWEFLEHHSLQGVLVASTMRFTTYDPTKYVPGSVPNTMPWPPVKITEFHLISASENSVDAAQFDPTGLVSIGDAVQQNTPHGSTVVEIYDPKLGTVAHHKIGTIAEQMEPK